MGFITKLGGIVIAITVIYMFLGTTFGITWPFPSDIQIFSPSDWVAYALLALGVVLLVIGLSAGRRHPVYG